MAVSISSVPQASEMRLEGFQSSGAVLLRRYEQRHGRQSDDKQAACAAASWRWLTCPEETVQMALCSSTSHEVRQGR